MKKTHKSDHYVEKALMIIHKKALIDHLVIVMEYSDYFFDVSEVAESWVITSRSISSEDIKLERAWLQGVVDGWYNS